MTPNSSFMTSVMERLCSGEGGGETAATRVVAWAMTSSGWNWSLGVGAAETLQIV